MRSNYGKGMKGLCEDKQPLYPRTENDEKLSNLDVEDFKCHQCTCVGSNKTMIQDQRKKHRELKYKCDLCDFKCPAEYRLRQHLNSKHEGHQSKRKKLKEDEK